MDVILLIFASVLIYIAIDIFRFPKGTHHMNQLQKDEYLFGENRPVNEYVRQYVYRRSWFPTGNHIRPIAVIFLLAGIAIGLKVFGVFGN